MRSRARITRVIVVAGLCVGLLALTPLHARALSSTALAQPVPMTLDCASLSGHAAAYATAHGYCSSIQGGTREGAMPYGTVYGNCGSSWLYAYNQANGGWVSFQEGARSTMGPIASVGWNVRWTNYSRGTGGNVSGFGFVFSSTWNHWDSAFTGKGSVFASMTGSVALWWGGTCYFLYPSDSTFVT